MRWPKGACPRRLASSDRTDTLGSWLQDCFECTMTASLQEPCLLERLLLDPSNAALPSCCRRYKTYGMDKASPTKRKNNCD